MSQTILIDLDGIVVDMGTRWYADHNAETGDNLCHEMVTDWDVSKFARGGTRVFDIINRPGFYLRPDPLPGALRGLRQLHDAGHRVIIASACTSADSYRDKVRWMEKWISWFPHKKQLMLGYAKELLHGNVLFDDGPHNIRSFHEAWPSAKIATIAYPYNDEVCHRDGPVDLIAGHYCHTDTAWEVFVEWVEWLDEGS